MWMKYIKTFQRRKTQKDKYARKDIKIFLQEL